ncbi:MAG: histone deacetylase [Myxococcota bacterium]
MHAKRAIAVVEDSRFLDHVGPPGHPEQPERLNAVGSALDARTEPLSRLAPRPATADEILRVHSRTHFDEVHRVAERAPAQLDPDTYVSPDSFDVALLAAGASVDLAARVARREAASGLAAVRPPGHHAESDCAMGFCLFNNVAIAARALQEDLGVERILVVDWDVHHGNGTQHFFEDDPTVLYVSTHQFPFYPGTGSARETGVGVGEGFTLNIPLPADCGDSEYVGVFQQLVTPAAIAFRPEMILISAGFDAHCDDPLASMNVTADGFRAMASIARALADDMSGGRLAFILEGGYSASGLIEGVASVMDAIVGSDPTDYPADVPAPSNSVLQRVVKQVSDLHGRDFSRLKAV